MSARDPHRFVNELDEAAIQRLIARLESRAKDQIFSRLFFKYAAQLALPESAKVLEVGCGTGAMTRFLAQRDEFSGIAYGIDQSEAFINAATGFAHEENVGDRIKFLVGDVHHIDFPDSTFDAVIAHTLISHVTEPITVLKEMVRVTKPGGTVIIFDGDYASLTFAYPDHEFGHKMDNALAQATFNNTHIMRDLASLLPDLGLVVSNAWGDAIVEIGKGSYFKSFAEAYAPYVIGSGLIPQQAVEEWLSSQLKSMENGTFFASCNYYTYLAKRII